MTLTAVIPGPADDHRAEHRVHALGPAAGQIRLLTAAARHARAGIPAIAGQQAFQHATAQPDQPGPDRLLGTLQALPGRHRHSRRGGQPITSAAPSAASAAASSWPSRPLFPPATQGPWCQAPLTPGARRRSPRSPPRSDRQRPEPLPLPGLALRLIQLRARPRMRDHRLATRPPDPLPLRSVTPLTRPRTPAIRLAALAEHRAQRPTPEIPDPAQLGNSRARSASSPARSGSPATTLL